MTEQKALLQNLATVIRSKNAGPFELTMDVFFKDAVSFEMARESGAITAARVADLYKVDVDEVLGITWFEPVLALKVTLKRRISSASPGDTDVFGAQQHVPLMMLAL